MARDEGEGNRCNGHGEVGPSDLDPDSSGGIDGGCEFTSNV